MSCLSVIVIFVYRKYVCGNRRRRRVGTRNDRRILLSVHLFLSWFVLTWSPWVLYDLFQSILNLNYSVYNHVQEILVAKLAGSSTKCTKLYTNVTDVNFDIAVIL